MDARLNVYGLLGLQEGDAHVIRNAGGVVTADEIPPPQALGLRLWVNGELRQNGTTADMLFGVNHLVWYISQFLVLRPGDIVNTGTPAGVALGRAGGGYLRPGDTMRLEIDGLGAQLQSLGAA